MQLKKVFRQTGIITGAAILSFGMFSAMSVMAEEPVELEVTDGTVSEALTVNDRAEDAQAEEAAPAAEDAVAAEAAEQAENKVQIELINQTGQDITFITVETYDPAYYPNGDVKRMQEALIEQGFLDDEADGSFGPMTQAAVDAFRAEKGLSADGGADDEMLTALFGSYSDGNLLKKDAVLAADETLQIPAADNTERKSDTETEDSLAAILADYGMEPDCLLIFCVADDDTRYVVHTFPPKSASNIALHLENGIAYVTYTDENGEDSSNWDIENAIYNAEHPEPVYDDYDDYADYAYYDDYAYDPGAYYYEEPVYADTGAAGDGCIGEGALFNP